MSRPVNPNRSTYPNYPDRLEPIRQSILAHLSNDPSTYSQEIFKISNCRYRSLCRSIYCPYCLHSGGHSFYRAVLQASMGLPRHRLCFATFAVRDVPLAALRAACKEIMASTRKTFSKLETAHYACHLETSFEKWSEDYHPHAHALIDSPSGGRRFISPDQWETQWLHSLPPDLRPRETGTHVKPVRDLAAACSYLSKSPFHEWVAGRTARTIATIQATKGLHKVIQRGHLAA
ncbi:protein rep [Edaphobacter paludis]|uniref:protein rep n=1 Tax=Edaphobacter paludis TaxID=3035702 RepID=UPI0035A0E9CA